MLPRSLEEMNRPKFQVLRAPNDSESLIGELARREARVRNVCEELVGSWSEAAKERRCIEGRS